MLTQVMIKSKKFSQKDLKSFFEKYIDYFRPFILKKTIPYTYNPKDFNKNKRLRIGYLSSDFYCHAMMSFVLPIIENHDLISFCTYARLDNIQPTDLTPWMGYIYTFPEHRGHHYLGYLFEEVERLARQDHVSQVYISTDHIGLYEKYGCEYLTEMEDVHGEPSRIYVKRFE